MNNTDYDCINDYSNFNAHLSPTNGLRPGKPLGDENNYLFKIPHRGISQDMNNCPSHGQYSTKLRQKYTHHNPHAMNCRQNPQNHVGNNSPIIETFDANYGLVDTVPLMEHKVDEANRNMQLLLETDSALQDYKMAEKIREKEREDKKYIERQRIQNERMERINKQMSEIELLRHTAMAEYQKLRGVQAQVSGKKLAVTNLNENGEFMIKANNKCLAFEKVNEYGLMDCNDMDAKQKFKLNPISNPLNYQYVLADSNSNISSATYPFFVVQPTSNHKQCLHAGSGNDAVNISIQPCDVSDSQKWDKVNDSLDCVV